MLVPPPAAFIDSKVSTPYLSTAPFDITNSPSVSIAGTLSFPLGPFTRPLNILPMFINPPPLNFGVGGFPDPDWDGSGSTPPKLLIAFEVAPTVKAVAPILKAPVKSFPFPPLRKLAIRLAPATFFAAKSFAIMIESFTAPFIKRFVSVPMNLPNPVPNLKYSAKRSGHLSLRNLKMLCILSLFFLSLNQSNSLTTALPSKVNIINLIILSKIL